MEFRLLMPLLIGAGSAVLLIVAELRWSGIQRICCVFACTIALVLSTWDLGELHRLWDVYYLRRDVGDAFTTIDDLIDNGQASEVHSTLAKQGIAPGVTPTTKQIRMAKGAFFDADRPKRPESTARDK